MQLGQSADAFANAVANWRLLDNAVAPNIARFIVTYPEHITAVTLESGKPIFLRMGSGASIVFEDYQARTFEQRLTNPSINNMLFDVYPLDLATSSWPPNFDPGRYRNSAFFKAVYGGSEKAVAANLVSVSFCGHKVKFNKQNGAAAALAEVGKEIESLEAKDASLKPYLKSIGGTFAWRPIEGTEQLSAHSFAIAIDLNPDLGGYWRWEKKDMAAMKRRLTYPHAIIEAFERHGFIWGGKWYHFDLMHFEFRPEFLGINPFASQSSKTEAASDAPATGQPKPGPDPEGDREIPVPKAKPISPEAAEAISRPPPERFNDVLRFGLNTYRHLVATSRVEAAADANLVIAPTSIYRSMEVLRWLAGGDTEQEIMRAMQMTERPKSASFQWPKMAPEAKLRQATSLWAPKSLVLPEATVRGLAGLFDTESHSIAYQPPDAPMHMINAWAVSHLGGKPIVTRAEVITDDAQLLLLSAFQCHSYWASHLSVANTKPSVFTDLSGHEMRATMMQGTFIGGTMKRSDGLIAVALPQAKSTLDVLILLPPPGRAGFEGLEACLTPDYIKGVVESLIPGSFSVRLPRFSWESTNNLQPTMQAQGLDTIFANAILPRLGKQVQTHVSLLTHHAAILFDESGADASSDTRLESSTEPITINRPFVFLLIDTTSRLPLVIGRIMRVDES